ncbi:MAG: hypothetical protein LBP59_01455 [Planctomycetaceae bacterium]|jgi:DNA-binding response OmpR family regulator|nr:hypothetical protein [Planctomycetaceae bacterium]
MKQSLFEIRDKIDDLIRQLNNLRAEEWSIIQLYFSQELFFEESLEFINDSRVVKWRNKSIRVGPKMYSLLKTIWEGKKHRATIEKIERKVWNVNIKNKFFIARHTIFTLICRTQKELKKNNFPYEIKTKKNHATKEIKGFQIIYTPKNNITVQVEDKV